MSVRPPVRHTLVLCLNDYTYPQSFSVPKGMEMFRPEPPKRGHRMHGGGGIKNHDFRPICRFISELMRDRVTVTMEGE